jgi:hypothetical protein
MVQDSTSMDQPQAAQSKVVRWFKRIGIAGFIFFLLKGLLWLIIPYLLAKGIF